MCFFPGTSPAQPVCFVVLHRRLRVLSPSQAVAFFKLISALAVERSVCCWGWRDITWWRDTTPQNVNLVPYSVHCLLCFSAVAGWSPWLFPQALTVLLTAHICQWHLWPHRGCTAASQLTCSLLGTVSELAPFPSPMEIAFPGSAVLGLTVTAHHTLLYCLDIPGCRLQAVLAFLQHLPLQRSATWAWCSLLPEWRCFCPVSSDHTGPWVDVMLIWLALLPRKCLWPSPCTVGHAKEEEWCQHIH